MPNSLSLPKPELPRAQKSRTITAKTESISLASRGVPSTQPLLRAASEWVRDVEKPVVNGAPHFIAKGGAQPLHLFHGSRGWQIAPDLDAGVAYAIAPGVTAAHPNTVWQGEWQLPTEPNGGWAFHPEFHVSTEGPNTEDRPFSIQDIGADFFLRVKTTKLVWYVDPCTGEVVHSGAKNAGKSARPGKRYCPLCRTCFSANNFVSQHIKNLHTPPPPSPPVVLVDGDLGALLHWKPDGSAAGAQPCAYSVQFSDDGGLSWQMAIANTGSSDPRARIAALQLGRPYLFHVAVIGLAATGSFSPPSEPFLAMESAAPADVSLLNSGLAAMSSRGHPSPMDAVANMNSNIVELTPEASEAAVVAAIAPSVAPNITPPSVVAPQAAARASPARASPAPVVHAPGPAAAVQSHPSLKRKASFGDGLTPALQEYLDFEIDRVLAESTADLSHAELVGDHVELKLSIPVPKEFGMHEPLPVADAMATSAPPAKRVAAPTPSEASGSSPPLTPPLSPAHASFVAGPLLCEQGAI